jgi:predicted kinase
MELVIFMGVQGSGKSSFYRERFFTTHVRINLDMLKTRNRERLLLDACLQSRQRAVIDNTNSTKAERRPYIDAAKSNGFRVLGYYFQSQVEVCKQRNLQRPIEEQVPLVGLLGTYGRLELPHFDEGFDSLHYVRALNGGFTVEEWQHEV